MTEQKGLFLIPYCVTFDEKFIIEDDMNFLINNMKVYAYKKEIDKQINFEIKVINNKKVIYPLEYADLYFLYAVRLVSGIKLETNADEFRFNGNNCDFCINLGENCWG